MDFSFLASLGLPVSSIWSAWSFLAFELFLIASAVFLANFSVDGKPYFAHGAKGKSILSAGSSSSSRAGAAGGRKVSMFTFAVILQISCCVGLSELKNKFLMIMAFGKLLDEESEKVAVWISDEKTHSWRGYDDIPDEPIVIKSITRI